MPQSPPYPVIDPEPSIHKCLTSFGGSELVNWAAFTGLGAGVGRFGYKAMPGKGMLICGSLGFIAGLMHGVQTQFNRYRGFREP